MVETVCNIKRIHGGNIIDKRNYTQYGAMLSYFTDICNVHSRTACLYRSREKGPIFIPSTACLSLTREGRHVFPGACL